MVRTVRISYSPVNMEGNELVRALLDVNDDESAASLQGVTVEQFCRAFEICVNDREDECADVLRNILKTLKGEEERSFEVARRVLELLQTKRLAGRVAADLVSHISLQVNQAPARIVVRMAEFLETSVASDGVLGGKWMDLIPRVLNRASSLASDGSETCVRRFIAAEWNPGLVVDLVASLRDLASSDGEMRSVIERCLRSMKEVDPSTVPALAYQLLLLSVKGHRDTVLSGIFKFFRDAEGKGPDEDSVRCQGDVILHVFFAVKYDQEMGRELIKFTKVPRFARDSMMTPFCLSLLLTISRIERFSDQILSTIKDVIVKTYETSRRCAARAWLRGVLPEPVDVEGSVLALVDRCASGWEHVTDGLVELGFALLGVPAAVRRGPSKGDHESTATVELGLRMITKVFKEVKAAQKCIIRRALDNTCGGGDTAGDDGSGHHSKLLSLTVRCSAYAYLESAEKVKSCFDVLLWAPYPLSRGLMDAVQPLLALKTDLRGALLLVVRKAMFSRRTETRRSAAYGVLKILLHFPSTASVVCSQSQGTAEVHTPISLNASAAVRAELVSMCKHALTQQMAVRAVIYEGLPKVAATESAGSAVLEMLHQHVLKWWNPAGGSPVNVAGCFSDVGGRATVVEPLPNLLRCVWDCVHVGAEGAKRERDLVSFLEEVAKYFKENGHEDVEADASPVADLLLGVYDFLIEYALTKGEPSGEAVDDASRLFSRRRQLSESLKDKAKSGPKKKKKTVESPEPALCPPKRSIAAILETLLADGHGDDPLNALRNDDRFVGYAVTSAVSHIHELKLRVEDGDGSAAFETCVTVGRALLRTLSKDGAVGSETRLSAFVRTVDAIKDLFPSRLEEFLSQVSGGADRGGEGTAVENFVERIQPACSAICEAETSKETEGWAALMDECVTAVSDLPVPESTRVRLSPWLTTLCKERAVGKHGAKLLVSLLCWLSPEGPASFAVFSDLCQEIRLLYGDVDEDADVTRTGEVYSMVSNSTAPVVTQATVNRFVATCGDAEWAVNTLKTSRDEDRVDDGLKAACVRLRLVSVCLHQLVRASLPLGPAVGCLLRCLVRYYNALTCLTRCVLGCGAKGEPLCDEYLQLVRATGSQLTCHVYAFFIHVQSKQSPDAKDAKKKGKTCVKMLQDAKKIPDVVYAIETYERSLIQLGKKSQVNLMSSMKLSTARDFRINLSAVAEGDTPAGQDENAGPSQPKKRRLLRTTR